MYLLTVPQGRLFFCFLLEVYPKPVIIARKKYPRARWAIFSENRKKEVEFMGFL
jgi:hypothetical protein